MASRQDTSLRPQAFSWVLVSLLSVMGAILHADEVIPHRQDQAPNEPYSPEEALERMTVPDGFTVELVASEPDIVNPVAMAFDERGRIWVTESVEYPRKPAGRGRDRVKVLEDTDQDGRVDKVQVFADGLNIPTGVTVGYGGVWVLNAPNLLFFREKDGKQVSREVVVTGFGRTDTHELPNSLTWGPDGWLYGLNGVFNQCSIVSNNGNQYDFNCALWRVHPRTHEFQVVAEGTSNPYGLVWDSEGSAIIEACHWANDHLFHFIETGHYQRQAGAFPAFAIPLGSITDHSHQKTAYCGLALLDSDMFPAAYRGRVCIGNIHGGCLNMDRLERAGSSYLAHAEPDLLTANDVWFMPVSLKIGPDGCLYVLDWYDRYHCSQDAARDPQGVDRLKGRLYRVRYGDRRPVFTSNLLTETDEQLLGRLGSGNVFLRQSAQRILTERLLSADSDPATRPSVAGDRSRKLRGALQNLVAGQNTSSAGPTDHPSADSETVSRKARLHALWVLIGSGELDHDLHLKLLEDNDATVRAWAVRAAGNFGDVPPSICDAVTELARDPSPDVQLQVAIAARKMESCDALPVLVNVLAHCGTDKVIPSIAWQNLHPLLETEGQRFTRMLRDVASEATGDEQVSPAVVVLMPHFVERLLHGRGDQTASVVMLLEFATQHTPDRAAECIATVSTNLGGLSEVERNELTRQLRPFLERLLSRSEATPYRQSAQLLAGRLGLIPVDVDDVRHRFASEDESELARLEALQALVAIGDDGLLKDLPQVLTTATPEFCAQVLATLGRMETPKLADVILAHYSELDRQVQPLAVDLVMQRERWARKLLNAVLENKMSKDVLNANHLRKILESNDREALWAVEKAFGKLREDRDPKREKVVAEMSHYLRENLGDPVAGQRVFTNLCAQCHTIYGQGSNVGPDLTANGRASFDQLVSNIFDPSLVIGPNYQTFTVVTKDGRNLTGLIVEDNDQRIVIRMAGGSEERVPRNQVEYTRVSKLSMMPEGVESIFNKQELADLFAFLCLDKPPGDPTARWIPGSPNLAGELSRVQLEDARGEKPDDERAEGRSSE